jgi:peptide/nickel transport system substrate-binding protein
MLTADQLLNIKRGSHQIALDISSLDAGALARDKSLHLTRQPSPRVFYLFANDNPQVSDITPDNRFREAVRYALDYGALRSLAGPGARPAGGLIPSMIAGALPIQDAIKQDVARAKAALAASGIGDRPVTLEFPSDLTRSGVSYTTMAQKVQANLQAVGLNVSLSGSPVTTLLAKVHAGQVAFGLWAFIPDYLDPATFLITTPGGFIAQYVGWDKGSDPALEKLTAKALATTAAGARTSLYHRIQQQMNQRGPFIPLMQPPQVFVATSDLAGAAWSNAYSLDLTRIAPK